MKRISNIVWFFHFFQLHLFVLSARKCFVLRTNQGNLVNFLWISFLQMNQYVWFASEYIFASLHKGVYFVSVRCFLCTVQMDFIESKSERSDETKIPGKYCKNYSISFRLKKNTLSCRSVMWQKLICIISDTGQRKVKTAVSVFNELLFWYSRFIRGALEFDVDGLAFRDDGQL